MVEEEEQCVNCGFHIHGVLTRAISYHIVNGKLFVNG
jgi:hypothetical protein